MLARVARLAQGAINAQGSALIYHPSANVPTYLTPGKAHYEGRVGRQPLYAFPESNPFYYLTTAAIRCRRFKNLASQAALRRSCKRPQNRAVSIPQAITSTSGNNNARVGISGVARTTP